MLATAQLKDCNYSIRKKKMMVMMMMGQLLQWLHGGWLSMLIGWDKFVVWCFTPPSKVKIPWTFGIHPQWKSPWNFHWWLKIFPLSTWVVCNTVWKQWRKTLQLCKFSSCGYTRAWSPFASTLHIRLQCASLYCTCLNFVQIHYRSSRWEILYERQTVSSCTQDAKLQTDKRQSYVKIQMNC